jgi:hypothetical protein
MNQGDGMEKSFKDVNAAFDGLKEKFQGGEMSRQQFIDEMKKLRIKDDQGRYWMIGAQTGKWYFFDGKDWVQDDPPSQKEKKAICIHCGFETRLEAEVCARCGGTMKESDPSCEKCGAKIPKPFLVCPGCGTSAIGEPALSHADDDVPSSKVRDRDKDKDPETSVRVLRSVKPLSFLFFGGVLGAFAGLLAGTFAGATGYFAPSLGFLPAVLLEFQGKPLGGVLFALAGAVAGFAVMALMGFLKALVINLILSMIGGIEYQVGESGRSPKRKDRKEDSAEGRPFGLIK